MCKHTQTYIYIYICIYIGECVCIYMLINFHIIKRTHARRVCVHVCLISPQYVC